MEISIAMQSALTHRGTYEIMLEVLKIFPLRHLSLEIDF